MARRLVFLVALLAVVGLVFPGLASASTGTGAKTRVWGFDLVMPVVVRAAASSGAEHHPGNQGHGSDLPSRATLAAEGSVGQPASDVAGDPYSHANIPDPFDLGGQSLAKMRPATLVVNEDGVTWNAEGGVDFSQSEYLRPCGPGERNIVTIEYTGSRTGDYQAANLAAGLGDDVVPPEGPGDQRWTWHHLDDYDPETNTGTMQLVDQDAHRMYQPHFGGARQYKLYHGRGY